jgi:succinate-semialdehyde dehydrogenase/glutarate-semialdehyde dehydrogenase
MIAQTDSLALLMTLEMGKPLEQSRSEVAYAAEFFRWFSEEAVRVEGSFAVTPDGKGRMLVMRQPVGPCILITPWNFPMAMLARKIGPAVAAGCTMVVKPAPQTPLCALVVAEILLQAGLPAGVLNVVTTSEADAAVAPMLRDGRARKLSFTGSTDVGRILLRQCADTVMRTSLELGGNAPFIVFPDADLARTVDAAIIAKMRNMGEACTAANRFYVHRDVVEEFGERLGQRMRDLVVGPGTLPESDVGPLVDSAARDKVVSLVQDARRRGARVLVGGDAIGSAGYFFEPTVLMDVDRDSAMLKTEVFGPVAPVLTFADEDDVIAQANDTEWGLVAYIFTQDVDRALRVTERLEVGMVGLNTGIVSNPAAPFGGTKQSGLGREGGRAGIDEYLETKYLTTPGSTSVRRGGA